MLGKGFSGRWSTGLFALLIFQFCHAHAFQWPLNADEDFDGVLLLQTVSNLGQDEVSLHVSFMDGWDSILPDARDLYFDFNPNLVLKSSPNAQLIANPHSQGFPSPRDAARTGRTEFVLGRSLWGFDRGKRDFFINLNKRHYSQHGKPFLIQTGTKQELRPSDLTYDHIELRMYGLDPIEEKLVRREELGVRLPGSDELGPLEVVRAHEVTYSLGAFCGKELTVDGVRGDVRINLARPYLKILCIRLVRDSWSDFYGVRMRMRARQSAEQYHGPREESFDCALEEKSALQSQFSRTSRGRKDYWDIYPGDECLERISALEAQWSSGGTESEIAWEAQVYVLPQGEDIFYFNMGKTQSRIAFLQVPKLDWFSVDVIEE